MKGIMWLVVTKDTCIVCKLHSTLTNSKSINGSHLFFNYQFTECTIVNKDNTKNVEVLVLMIEF